MATISEIIPALLNTTFEGRVWQHSTPDVLPRFSDDSILPFAIWNLMGGQEQEYVEQSPAPVKRNARIQVSVFAPSALVADLLILEARDALLASVYNVGVYGSPVGTYDVARKLVGRFQQFSIWFQ